MRPYSKKINQKGFTLLEVLFALSILAIGLLATASMQGVALNSNTVANRISVANMIGQQVLDELHSRPITDPDLLNQRINWPFLLDPVTPSNRVTIRGAGTYEARYFTTPATPAAPILGLTSGLTEIVVRVFYVDPTTGVLTQTRTFTTYKMVI
jgi:prepilin-type N-terminal cleavage/methylation domain-containing protein